MKIYGPYTLPDGRKHVIVYQKGKRRTVSYPKFLIEQALGRILHSDEEVHHKDEDFTNNSLDNLEVLNRSNHRKIHLKKDAQHRIFHTYVCPCCSNEFEKEYRSVRNNQESKGRPGPFCSRSCSGRFNQMKQTSFRPIGISNFRKKRPFKKLALKLLEMRKNDAP